MTYWHQYRVCLLCLTTTFCVKVRGNGLYFANFDCCEVHTMCNTDDTTTGLTEQRFDDLDALAMNDIRRQRTAEWKTEETTLRDQVDGEMRERPDLAAEHWLRTGRRLDQPEENGPVVPPEVRKLSRQDITDLYGGNKSVLDNLPKGVLAKVGLHPDMAAEMLGFRSGDELVRSLMGIEAQRRDLAERLGRKSVGPAEHFARTVDEEVQRRMVERHGDTLKDGSIGAEALVAIHSERQAEVMAEEMKALARQVGVLPLDRETLQNWVRGQVADMPVSQGADPAPFARAEARAGRQVQRALLKGDVRTAFVAKQQQLLNHLLYREATDAEDAYEKGVKTFNRFAGEKTIASMDQTTLERIQQMLQRFGFDHPQHQPPTFEKTLAEWLGDKAAEGRDMLVPSFLLDERFSKPLDQLTVDQFTGLKEAIDSMAHVGREEKAAYIEGKRVEFAQLRQEALDQGEKLADLPRSKALTPGKPGAGIREDIFRFTSFLRELKASAEKMEQVVDLLDNGDPNGVFNRVVWRPIDAGLGKRSDWEAKLTSFFREFGRRTDAGSWRDMDKPLPTIPELTDPRTGEPMDITRKNLLAIALHTGTEDNFDRLVKGWHWSREGVKAALDRHLTKGDWDLVQHVWDGFEMTWPEVEALQKRLTGISPEKVEARQVETPFGTYRGGYMRIEYDPFRSPDVALRKARESDLFDSNWFNTTTRHGHTMERQFNVSRPILLDFDRVPSLLREVIHDFSLREAVVNANRFVTDRAVRDMIADKLGKEVYGQFRPWLKAIANDRASDVKELVGYQQIFRVGRERTSMVRLAGNIKTAVLHGGTAAMNSIGELGPKWALDGARAFFGAPDKMAAARDFVYERSPMMRHRMDEFDRDVREQLNHLMDKGRANWCVG